MPHPGLDSYKLVQLGLTAWRIANSQFVGAFLGATVSFGFFLLGLQFKSAYESRKRHWFALVSMEHEVLHLMNDLISTTKILRGFRALVARGNVTWKLPFELEALDEAVLVLHDTELASRLATVALRIRRFNRDILALNESYRQVRQMYFGNVEDRPIYVREYHTNAEAIASSFESIADTWDEFEDDLYRLLAMARLRWKKDKPSWWKTLSRRTGSRDPCGASSRARGLPT
jgi:hypothetical protein